MASIHINLTSEQKLRITTKARELDLSIRKLIIRAADAYEVPPSESTRIDQLTTRIHELETRLARLESLACYT